jgi:hypothetical protein
VIVLCYNWNTNREKEVFLGKKIVIAVTMVMGLGSAHGTDRKMILDAQFERKDILSAKHSAEELLRGFDEKEAQHTHTGLQLKIERLENYFLLTLAPIRSIGMENRLNQFIRPVFPQAFIVNEGGEKKTPSPKLPTPPIQAAQQHGQKEKADTVIPIVLDLKKQLTEGLNSEWLALIGLALLGFLMAARSALQIQKIKKLQQALDETQKQNSHYLSGVGRQYE